MRFQGGICPEKIQLYRTIFGRLSAIRDFSMRNILKIVSDSQIITIKQLKCAVSGRDMLQEIST